MHGSLALARGLLLVGEQAKTARVRAFDLGGRELELGSSFRDPLAGRSAVGGLAVDEDSTILVADTPADRVRRFSFFGREVGGIGAGNAGAGTIAPPSSASCSLSHRSPSRFSRDRSQWTAYGP